MKNTYKGSIPSVTPRIASNFGKRWDHTLNEYPAKKLSAQIYFENL